MSSPGPTDRPKGSTIFSITPRMYQPRPTGGGQAPLGRWEAGSSGLPEAKPPQSGTRPGSGHQASREQRKDPTHPWLSREEGGRETPPLRSHSSKVAVQSQSPP